MRLAKLDIRDFGQEIFNLKSEECLGQAQGFEKDEELRHPKLDQNSSLRGESYNSHALVDEF